MTVGCGRVNCNGRNNIARYLLACEYWPPGNYLGEFSENVGPLVKGAVDDAKDDDIDGGGSAGPTPTAASGRGSATPTATTGGGGNSQGLGSAGRSCVSSILWTAIVGLAAVLMAGLIS